MNEPLLALSPSYSNEMRLGYGVEVSIDGSSQTTPLDTLNPDHFGRPYLPQDGGPLKWFATIPKLSLENLGEFYAFHGGAIISPRVRDIIEDNQKEGIEFIPLNILNRKTMDLVDNWWFVNVFKWQEVFDFSKSSVEWESFAEPTKGWAKFEQKFGTKRICKIKELFALPSAYAGGLYLAKAPTELICGRVFIGLELADKLNSNLPESRKIIFDEFFLKNRPLMPELNKYIS